MEAAAGTKSSLSDLPPLVTKSGARQPGLAYSNSVRNIPKFPTPNINVVGGAGPATAAPTALSAISSKQTYQLKRRSDISHELLRAKSSSVGSTSAAGSSTTTADDDEDSFLLNQNLDSLYQNAKSSGVSDSKRTKLD